MKVELLVFDGFDEPEALASYEAFRHAGRTSGVDVALVTATGQATVTGGTGLRLEDLRKWTPGRADILVVAGGGTNRTGPGVRAELESGALPAQLRAVKEQAPDNFILAALCSGSLLLGAAGLLSGRLATTHDTVLARLREFGALPTKARVVDAGDIVTSSGVTCGPDVALYLVERTQGAACALSVEVILEYEPRRTVWQRLVGAPIRGGAGQLAALGGLLAPCTA
jgi:transcriptional regulator GlxA family with amidase domain